jgi:glycine/D-amino acid oxidase-like deaminating enzyme
VFVAANVPVNNRVWLHTKIAAYRSYVIAAEIGDAFLEPALFWDTADPYHYTRIHHAAGRTYLIVGGEDHRTGMESETERHFVSLARYAEERFGVRPIRYRWSGQIIEPVDGLPFIGLNSGSQHVYVATGYAGNGMTFGTLAGMMVSDLIVHG